MGRLGFNLVRQKEANKNIESGMADQQQQNEQNENNENVEIGELIIAIDRANRSIKNYRWLSITLIAVILTLCGYIFITQARFHSTQSVVHALNKMHEEYTNRIKALQGDHDAQAQKLERSQNLMLEENMQHELEEQKALREKESEKYFTLQEKFSTLQGEHEDLITQCQEKENSMQEEIQKLESERDELIGKIEATNRQLELQKSESQKLLTTTTTARPRFFGSNQLKKLNDLMKDIESVGRIVGNVFRDAI
ncbi:uncharacterized protein LOC131663909 isoform X2 [Phymastichus coffea]|uniref:uncharacterized protein LOC131663909 isoform X2 n=1 Tax=Phymastichus coffea TaxID=108790 RepID=UPI00273A7705|nr:uncharacterized protein LOC131663909 isoform X2 [Phymastichus coffea]